MSAAVAARPYCATEAQTLSAVMALLERHPKVAWRRRINSGAFKLDGERFFRAGFVGCSDIIGQLRGGKFLAVEVKSREGVITEAQEAFLDAVRGAGGVAFVARSADDVMRNLATA